MERQQSSLPYIYVGEYAAPITTLPGRTAEDLEDLKLLTTPLRTGT